VIFYFFSSALPILQNFPFICFISCFFYPLRANFCFVIPDDLHN
jgi:hypothetical protein